MNTRVTSALLWSAVLVLVLAGQLSPATAMVEDDKESLELQTAETDGDGHPGSDDAVAQAVQSIMEDEENNVPQCNQSRFYHIEGICNNLQHPRWGAAFVPLLRLLPNAYQDGKYVPRLYGEGTNNLLPSPRRISVECIRTLDAEKPRDLEKQHSQNLMQFGQYFSHDLSLSPVRKGMGCCETNAEGLHNDTWNGGPCYPIPIPDDDRRFTDCMEFHRSVKQDDANGVAEQLNTVTQFIDQSTVYGSTMQHALSLRNVSTGMMRTDRFGMLPEDGKHKCLLDKPLMQCPTAGDQRVNVFMGLTTTHLLFLLEHNRLVKKLSKRHPEWDGERLYQEARAILIAETQNLVYKEFLPEILGRPVMKFFKLNKPTTYDPEVNPGIFNAFSTAAFRFGHSQINNVYHLNRHSYMMLNDTYFRPYLLFNNQSRRRYADIMESLMTNKGQRVDPKFPRGVVDQLFEGVDVEGVSTDLPARNIHRGRDHGLPSYMSFLREAKRRFGKNLVGENIILPACLTYKSLEDVDLFLGGMYERHVRKGAVGPVFAYILGLQFQNLRKGDRLFFDSEGSQAGFTEAQINSIKQTGYSGIICRTTKLTRVPRNPFRIPGLKNPMVDCDQLADVDFSLW